MSGEQRNSSQISNKISLFVIRCSFGKIITETSDLILLGGECVTSNGIATKPTKLYFSNTSISSYDWRKEYRSNRWPIACWVITKYSLLHIITMIEKHLFLTTR